MMDFHQAQFYTSFMIGIYLPRTNATSKQSLKSVVVDGAGMYLAAGIVDFLYLEDNENKCTIGLKSNTAKASLHKNTGLHVLFLALNNYEIFAKCQIFLPSRSQTKLFSSVIAMPMPSIKK